MELLKKKYIVDENDRRIAVQLDIKTFNKIEEIMENYSLVQLMKANEVTDILEMNAAKKFYSTLDKAN